MLERSWLVLAVSKNCITWLSLYLAANKGFIFQILYPVDFLLCKRMVKYTLVESSILISRQLYQWYTLDKP